MNIFSPTTDGTIQSSLPVVCFENDVNSVISEESPKRKETKATTRVYKKKAPKPPLTKPTRKVTPNTGKRIKPKPYSGNEGVNEIFVYPSLQLTHGAMVPLSVEEKESSPLWNNPNELEAKPLSPGDEQNNNFLGAHDFPIATPLKEAQKDNLAKEIELIHLNPPEFVSTTFQNEEEPYSRQEYENNNLITLQQTADCRSRHIFSDTAMMNETENLLYNFCSTKVSSFSETIGNSNNTSLNNQDAFDDVWRSPQPIIESPVDPYVTLAGEFSHTTDEFANVIPFNKEVLLPEPKIMTPVLPIKEHNSSPAQLKPLEPAKIVPDSELSLMLSELNRQNIAEEADVLCLFSDDPNGSGNIQYQPGAASKSVIDNHLPLPDINLSFPSDYDSFGTVQTNTKVSSKVCEPTNDKGMTGKSKSLSLPIKPKYTISSTRSSSDSALPTVPPPLHSIDEPNKTKITNSSIESNSSTGCLPLSVERASPVDSTYLDMVHQNITSSNSCSDSEDSVYEDIANDNLTTASSHDEVFSSNITELSTTISNSAPNSCNTTSKLVKGRKPGNRHRREQPENINPSPGCNEVTDDDWRLAEATMKSEATGSNVPLLKEELRYRILQKHGNQRPENWDQSTKTRLSGDVNAKERRRRINRQSAKRCRRKEQDHYIRLKQHYLAELSKSTALKYEIGKLQRSREELAYLLHKHLKDCPLEQPNVSLNLPHIGLHGT